jgi:hypothetical protein
MLKTIPSSHDLLYQFSQLYKWSLEKAGYSALRLQGGKENFDYSNKLMFIDLRYRPECQGNPGLSFTVQNASLISKADLRDNHSFALQFGQSAILTKKMALRHSDDFIDLLVVLFATKDDFIIGYQAIYRHSADLEECVAQINHDVWLGELQKSVDSGFVFRLQEDSTARLGRMKFNGLEWSWAALSDAEVKSLGLATISELGLKGEGLSMRY